MIFSVSITKIKKNIYKIIKIKNKYGKYKKIYYTTNNYK